MLLLSKPFCYNCFDSSYRDKQPFSTRISQVYSIQSAKTSYLLKSLTPNLVASIVLFRFVFLYYGIYNFLRRIDKMQGSHFEI